MKKNDKKIDVHEELLVQRWGSGIKLAKNDHRQTDHPGFTMAEIFALPINCYFLDTNSNIRAINEDTVMTCGFLSRPDAIGKSAYDITTKAVASRIVENDQEVIRTQSMKIVEEYVTRLDNVDFHALSIKFPWFNTENKIIGVCGFSILSGFQGLNPMSESLTLLVKTGILAPSASTNLIESNLQQEKLNFTKPEMDVLYHLTRGKTAKDIAKILGLSHRTIEHRLEKIKIKLGVSSKSELIEKVIDYFK